MLTPAYPITATERVLPRLALDFTTASLDPRITFTRAGNTATVINSAGVIAGINADLPRFDYDPLTLVCRGLLIEEARTNALLNSLINGTNLSTQSVTVTAAARTLSFYGIGQIVLSGAHSATVVGTGAYPTRTTLTFTPSAGTLTLTVTGTVQFAQLELGSFATSFIPTAGTAVTRNADVATMTGTNFSDWFNASEGTFAVNAQINYGGTGSSIGLISATVSGSAQYLQTYANMANGYVWASGYNTSASQFDRGLGSVVGNTSFGVAFGYKVNDVAAAKNGDAVSIDTSAINDYGSVDLMRIGALNTGTVAGVRTISKISYWPQRLTNAEVQANSK